MAAPNTTVWKLEPHTQAKHEILRKYLNAWFPILGNSGFQTVLYIDGFSGPGRYSNGEDGSPVIAILAAINQRIPIRSKLHFRFIEKDSERANMLDQIVKESSLPANFDAKVFNSTFEKTFYELLNFYTTRQGKLPPTFAFIDPFGWTGSPFTAVREILSNPNCEVLFTFMYEEVNRFINHPDQENNFDLYFGTSDWKDGVSLTDPKKRDRFFHNLYQQQLRNTAKAKISSFISNEK